MDLWGAEVWWTHRESRQNDMSGLGPACWWGILTGPRRSISSCLIWDTRASLATRALCRRSLNSISSPCISATWKSKQDVVSLRSVPAHAEFLLLAVSLLPETMALCTQKWHATFLELGEAGSLWSEDDSVGPFQTLTTTCSRTVLFGSLSCLLRKFLLGLKMHIAQW